MPEETYVVAVPQVEVPAVVTTPGVTFTTTMEEQVGLEATATIIASQRMD